MLVLIPKKNKFSTFLHSQDQGAFTFPSLSGSQSESGVGTGSIENMECRLDVKNMGYEIWDMENMGYGEYGE